MRAPADRCPICGAKRNAPPVRPFWSPREKAGQITAWYRCKACKCRWLVSWLASALGEAAA